MTGLDCNILVQLAVTDHPDRDSAITAIRAEVLLGNKLVFPPLIVTEFLHIVTDVRRFQPALEMSEALEWMEEFLANPGIQLVPPTDASLALTMRWMKQYGLGRKRILDTHFAAILQVHGVQRLVTSNPRDFKIFNIFEIISPPF